jgi:hypothetical protein
LIYWTFALSPPVTSYLAVHFTATVPDQRAMALDRTDPENGDDD